MNEEKIKHIVSSLREIDFIINDNGESESHRFFRMLMDAQNNIYKTETMKDLYKKIINDVDHIFHFADKNYMLKLFVISITPNREKIKFKSIYRVGNNVPVLNDNIEEILKKLYDDGKIDEYIYDWVHENYELKKINAKKTVMKFIVSLLDRVYKKDLDSGKRVRNIFS